MNALDALSYRLVEWLLAAAERGQTIVSPSGFARDEGLTDSDLRIPVRQLVDQRILTAKYTGGGDPYVVSLTGHGITLAKQFRQQRQDTKTRNRACRSQLLAWMYDQADADEPDSKLFFTDLRSVFLGEIFTVDEVVQATVFLAGQGLIRTGTAAGTAGVVMARITPAGVRCVEDFDADVVKYLNHQETRSVNVNIEGDVNGNVAVAGRDMVGVTQNATTTIDTAAARTWADTVARVLPVLGATTDQTAELQAGLAEVRAAAEEPTPNPSRLGAAVRKTLLLLSAVVTVSDTAQLVKMLIETGSQLLG